jgi:type IV secretion system protein VirB10
VISAAVLWALQNKRGRRIAEELYSTDHKVTADGLAGLPRDYAGIPREAPPLGPPLPGDLGRPILAAQGHAIAQVPVVDPEEQRRAQEMEAARTSRLFASTNVRQALAGDHGAPPDGERANLDQRADDYSTQNGQDRKLAFVNASVDTGIRSDLPGQITAQVTENVYDSPTGRLLLIPQGARLVGAYDSQVAFGQSRVLLVWTRLIMPNGRSIVLERQQGADAGGYSGLEDEVDRHWGTLFKAALLSTLLSVGSEAGVGSNENSLIQAIRHGGSQSFNQTGQQIVGRNLNVQPTLTIRPGFPVRVIVNRDLVLEPYRG